MNGKIKILLVEDHQLVAKLLMAGLNTIDEFEIVHIATNGEEAFRFVENNNVDIIVLDIDMPVMDGIQALNLIRLNDKVTKIIMLSNHTEAWLIRKAIKKGANGYVTKFVDIDELIEGIHKVLKGEIYLCSTSMNNIGSGISINEFLEGKIDNLMQEEREHTSFGAKYQSLTKREQEIIKLIMQEYSTKEIAASLFISFRTVETHRKNILKKFGLHNTTMLVKEAVESGLFEH